jgi:hypothetical protein
MNWSTEFKEYCLNKKLEKINNPSGCWQDFNKNISDYFFLKRIRYFNVADGLLNFGDLPESPNQLDYPNNCE